MVSAKTHEDVAAITAGDRRAFARAITLVESTRADHARAADELILGLAAARGDARPSLRIGLTGTPGVGKSTFIESFGLFLCDQGLRVAVLAVDPSSQRTGGAILGDKTRMPDLSRRKEAFVRPSPSSNMLGGVAAKTASVIELCEGAGFDVILVETVGVGQSETTVAELTDIFALLLAPGGGDELQGVKRGIMELADLVLVNKADGATKQLATRTAADYAGALRLLRRPAHTPEGFPKALTISALEGVGLEETWAAMGALLDWRRAQGVIAARRRSQALTAFERALDGQLLSALKSQPHTIGEIEAMRKAVQNGELRPDAAAARLARALLGQ